MSRITQITMASLAAAAMFGGGCVGEPTIGSGDDDDGQPMQATETSPLSDALCLRKMALDLTHAAPSDDNHSRLAKGDVNLDQLADEYLASPEFSQVAFDWMRSEFTPTALTNEETDVEEPARLMHYILMKDRDWRETMTATYTVDADGVEHEITDRPAAGILSTKYSLQSTVGSFRRNWAGRLERQFAGITLVAVTIPAGSTIDVTPDGLASNPDCAGCHVHPVYGIDALARFAQCYDETGERIAGCEDPEASFLLQSGRGLVVLRRLTAATNEFKSQSIDFFFKRLFGRDIAREEAVFYTQAASVFAASGYHARELIKHLVTSEAYCSR
jgi:hypothetical protein